MLAQIFTKNFLLEDQKKQAKFGMEIIYRRIKKELVNMAGNLD